jgi:4a-hydroxytetrahydrobiopterin dehydratase
MAILLSDHQSYHLRSLAFFIQGRRRGAGMQNLLELHCTRPKAGEGLSAGEIESYLEQVPDWGRIKVDGIPHIERVYPFKNFSQALAFTVRVGILAEKEDHHPSITTEWGKVTVTYWTHTIQGLHLNDFISAARVDQLLDG